MPSSRRKAKSQEFWTEEEVLDFGLGGEDEGHFESDQKVGSMALAADHHLFGSPVSNEGATPASEITKSGRMRKKTAKLIEMEEIDKLEKIPRKSDIVKAKKSKPAKSSADRLHAKTSSALTIDTSNFSEDSGDLAPLVIANVFSLSSAERSNLDPLMSEATPGSKSTKTTKAKKQKAAAAAVAQSENFSALFGSGDLDAQSRAAVLGSAVASEQVVLSTSPFSDVEITASTKRQSKKKANAVVPPLFTIKLESPSLVETSHAGRNVNEMALSLAGSYPEVLPHLHSPLAVKEELEHSGAMIKDEEVVATVRKEKSKKKHKTATMDMTESTDECLLLNLMPENQAKKKKRLVIGQQLPNPRKESDKPKKKRQKGYTAYMLWCSVQRAKVVTQNPGIDFAQISKRLGDMWQTVPEKEKMTWRRKARRMTKKGSSLIKTGLNAKDEMSMAEVGHRKMLYNTKPLKIRKIVEDPISKVTSIDHIDVAAHFKLLGESLTTIGARLQEHGGHIAVQGSLSVLLDSLLCTLGPLMAVTNQVPQINGTPEETHRSTLENIAYIMPGVG